MNKNSCSGFGVCDMELTGLRVPQQTRSQHALERILSSSTALIGEKSYEDVSIAEIASRAKISVGSFYSRFENKDALFGMLLHQLEKETHDRIDAALERDWSKTSLRELLHFIVKNNAEIYEKYRGILIVVHINARLVQPKDDKARRAYNEKIVAQVEKLVLTKRNEMHHQNNRVAIRTAIACMSAMLRDAIVFGEKSMYPKPRNRATVIRHVAEVMYRYLLGDAS